ncbi:HNH endonuclease [Nocardioides solisilvae]|uniref:HNH endonuclease n=1 Tax=Nocardioides solisilvae TaxID=1542435 RepID=UPI003B847C05
MLFTCRGCGLQAEGRPNRVFCSNRCQRAVERRERVAGWLETGDAPHAGTAKGHDIRRHIGEEQQGLCALCARPGVWNGRPLVLVLDHIDGDSENNRLENLRLVCPHCDSQLDTFKARNPGRGRHVVPGALHARRVVLRREQVRVTDVGR